VSPAGQIEIAAPNAFGAATTEGQSQKTEIRGRMSEVAFQRFSFSDHFMAPRKPAYCYPPIHCFFRWLIAAQIRQLTFPLS
jgi:hypothetical protein